MFDHVKFGVSDYAVSKAFFLKALAPLGVAVVSEGPPAYGVEISRMGKASLCLYQTGEKPVHLHLAFRAENREQVEAFYRAALAAGGKDNGAPGLPCELLCSFRHWSRRAQHRSGLQRTRGLTLASRASTTGFDRMRPPFVENLRSRNLNERYTARKSIRGILGRHPGNPHRQPARRLCAR